MRNWARASAALAFALLLCGCSYQTYQSVFSGDAAAEVHDFHVLFAVFLIVCAIMYALVIGFLFLSLARARRAGEANVLESGRHHQTNPLMRTLFTAWLALIATGLFLLAVASFFGDRSMAKAAANEQLSIVVTGNQWWWDVTYNSADVSKMIRTANEIHVPVGVPTRIILK